MKELLNLRATSSKSRGSDLLDLPDLQENKSVPIKVVKFIRTKDPQLRTSRYRLLALASFITILLILSVPGHWIEAIQSWLQLWWPWPSSSLASADIPFHKLVHASLFALCAALFVRGWTMFRERWLWVCVMLTLYGGVTELIQRYVPGRSATLGDWLADGVGVLAGVGLALWYLRKREEQITLG
ncbi:MAG: VanZ family protein [Gammaproteobacteria bacterium]|nr:VanZ family protein [Gammaproteobacteria bacterium]